MKDSWDTFLQRREAERLAAGLERALKAFDGAGPRQSLDGRKVLSFASNDYLGLSQHPEVLAGACAAIKNFGAGSTASALVCGNKTIHARLARALAEFKNTESALILPSGYQASLATLGALADDETSILLDKLSHASLIDGARLSGARVRTFQHNDLADLKNLLLKESARRCIVVVESLYSMDGDLAPLEELIALTRESGALLLVDEAHSTGVIEIASLKNAGTHVIRLGTLSKALGAQGGFVCATGRLTAEILNGRAHMFSTALNPGSAGAALAALSIVAGDEGRRLAARLKQISDKLRSDVRALGFETPSTEGPILPLIVGDEARAVAASKALYDAGFFVPAIRFPTVKRGEARLRISVSAAHTELECEGLLRELRLWKSEVKS